MNITNDFWFPKKEVSIKAGRDVVIAGGKITNSIAVKILNPHNLELPKYETEGSAGMDLAAYMPNKESYFLGSSETKIFDTGLSIQVPPGYEMQIRSRSGLAAKNSILVLNSPGTIDSDYTGELKVILHNVSSKSFEIKNGMRIAQMVLNEIPRFHLSLVEELEKTDRGTGGLGSTGVS